MGPLVLGIWLMCVSLYLANSSCRFSWGWKSAIIYLTYHLCYNSNDGPFSVMRSRHLFDNINYSREYGMFLACAKMRYYENESAKLVNCFETPPKKIERTGTAGTFTIDLWISIIIASLKLGWSHYRCLFARLCNASLTSLRCTFEHNPTDSVIWNFATDQTWFYQCVIWCSKYVAKGCNYHNVLFLTQNVLGVALFSYV